MRNKPLWTKGMPTRAFTSPARLAAGVLLGLTLLATHLQAFSLMGPFADWMTPALNFQLPDDVGGPMDINEEYRWNVPILTYAFDASFVDYFGSNGVVAIEQAFEMLNNLPPVSSLNLTNYPMEPRRINYRAMYYKLYDLKSATLPLLLEQMGLTEPSRNVYVLRRWDPIFASVPSRNLDYLPLPEYLALGLIIQRNYDPDTLLPSRSVNEIWHYGWLQAYGPSRAYIINLQLEPSEYGRNISVAGFKNGLGLDLSSKGGLVYGHILVNFTQDDVGGLRYLLSSNNINPEILLSDVHGTDTNAGAYVNLALRPGLEKITFQRQDYDALLGQAVPFTYQFTDTYITNGIVMHQQLERVVTQPDFLFSAADTGESNPWTRIYVRSSTSIWWNSAQATGQTNNGPGIIRSPVRITFHKPGPVVHSDDASSGTEAWLDHYKWGSFDDSTNPPVVYPHSTLPDSETLTMRFRLYQETWDLIPTQIAHYIWDLPVRTGEPATLQVSTNLVDWNTCAVVTNQDTLIEWQHFYSAHPQKFFRVVPH